MKTVDTFNFSGKKALIRVDFNVPLNDKYEITDDTRLKAVIPTINKIIKDGEIKPASAIPLENSFCFRN